MKIGNNGNLVWGPFDESTPCLMIVLMNCQTKLRINHLTAVKSVAILENPVRLCEFRKLNGKILKTVDAVYQDVTSLDECRQKCLSVNYRCQSFDYGDPSQHVCRLSHHSVATLTHIQDPYLDIPGVTTYEISACYNATRGLLATDHVILNHGQVTWTTPELAPPLLTTTPHQREDVSALDRFNVHRCPTRRVFSGTGIKLVTRQATIRYLYHSATAATR
ncbi:apple domain-containing protein [Trichonephila clavipes]|uniref:Apple domain-containing protein n=1 Tax=Trichonephila clavipes TaxID=2585209 RepID=A0A8X6RR93_TRICX|nr:apple domain-containing protein [Trichonephila clavipes]